MYLCYFDESGDPGYAAGSPSKAYALAGVIVHESAWSDALDDLIGFRRFLRDNLGVPMRVELKANYLMRNAGPFRKLHVGDDMRRKILRMGLALPAKLAGGYGANVFAVVCDKEEMKRRGCSDDPRGIVWGVAIERLERFTAGKDERCMVLPDEGNERLIRLLLRQKRRISLVPSRFGTAPLSRPARLVVEDPSVRTSSESYFVQLADLVAYAAYRAIYPGADVGADYWELLGSARLAAVNKYAGGKEPTALIVWPRRRTWKAP